MEIIANQQMPAAIRPRKAAPVLTTNKAELTKDGQQVGVIRTFLHSAMTTIMHAVPDRCADPVMDSVFATVPVPPHGAHLGYRGAHPKRRAELLLAASPMTKGQANSPRWPTNDPAPTWSG